MLHSGRVAFGAMEAVVFGRPAAEAVAEEARRLDAERVFLMVSGTLNRSTDEIAQVRRTLGNRLAGIFDRMPPHTPRRAVIEAAAAAREAGADLIVTIGGGSVTDGAKAVQLCLANDIHKAEELDRLRPVKGPDGALGPPPCNAPSVAQVTVPTTLSAGEFSAIAGVTDERHQVKELFRHRRIIPRRGVGPGGHGAHARMAVAVDRHPRCRPLRRGDLLGRGQSLCRCPGIARVGAALPGAAAGQGRSQ